jgi:hypothetical protein
LTAILDGVIESIGGREYSRRVESARKDVTEKLETTRLFGEEMADNGAEPGRSLYLPR